MINDPYEIAVLRWESLFEIGLAPCTNARELIFGPSQDVRDAFEVGRRDLARWRSDTLLIEMYEQGPERMRFDEQDSEVEQDVFTRFVVGAADLTGSLLGNDRIRGCARVWAAISSFS